MKHFKIWLFPCSITILITSLFRQKKLLWLASKHVTYSQFFLNPETVYRVSKWKMKIFNLNVHHNLKRQAYLVVRFWFSSLSITLIDLSLFFIFYFGLKTSSDDKATLTTPKFPLSITKTSMFVLYFCSFHYPPCKNA